MLIPIPQGRYCPSRSAPTPNGVGVLKSWVKCVTALRRHFRRVRCFSSRLARTHDAKLILPMAGSYTSTGNTWLLATLVAVLSPRRVGGCR